MQEELLRKYIESLKGRIKTIDALQEKLAQDKPHTADNIRLLGHSLRGSGASYGYPAISAAGQAIEEAAERELPAKLADLKDLLQSVVSDFDSGVSPAADTPAQPQPEPDPQAREPTAALPEDSTPAPGNGKIHPGQAFLNVLVVEDDPGNIPLIRTALERLGRQLQVHVTGTAAEAQEFLVKEDLDLVILDIVLPDRDGRELLREIKLDFKLETPVLVMSAISTDTVRVECMSLGADKYLLKPLDLDILIGELDKMLKRVQKSALSLVPMGQESAGRARTAETRDKDDLKGKQVLVVEDDATQADLIRQRLMQAGLAVKHAANGRDAMQELRASTWSLVILDVKMPMMDGFEVLERIRGELGLKGLPVVMVTAMGSEADIIRGYDLGVNDYILKPYSEVQLIARVKSLLK